MARLSRADVVAWVRAVYLAHDAEQWVTEGPAAFQVRIDDGRTHLVRKRTGQYWDFPGESGLHTARSDWRLRRALGKLFAELDQSTRVIHDPAMDLTEQQLRAWLATEGRQLTIGQIIDRGWAFLAIKGRLQYGGLTGSSSATLAVIKRTGEVWDLLPGTQAEAAYFARTEAGFRAVAPWGLQPIAHIPR